MQKKNSITILWDFDGTLGYHNYGYFDGVIIKVLKDFNPNFNVDKSYISSLMRGKLPWHKPEIPHLDDISNPIKWWNKIERVFYNIFLELKFSDSESIKMAKKVHTIYANPKNFTLYDDTFQILSYFLEKGYNNFILTNNIPELPEIITKLGIGKLIKNCFSSANIGYEKPNKNAFSMP